MSVPVKICGLKDRLHVDCAVTEGAAFVGFNLHPKSPRAVSVENARNLSQFVLRGCKSVVLFVDPRDRDLDAVLDFADYIQLHGQEDAVRIADIRARTQKPIIKALPIAGPEDIASTKVFSSVADILLFDAKPSKPNDLAGGGGAPFDWRLLEGQDFDFPWMLAGGLTPENIGAAIAQTGAPIVDVSSGVETGRGLKDSDKIKAFMKAATSQAEK